jgi:tRNA uridine 5-carboxymethylaminomethyl modification enzyme
VRFAQRERHTVWLEPEGYDSGTHPWPESSDWTENTEGVFYPGGISNSMPEELQEAMLRTVPGLENVKMVRPAYGVEYDFVDPKELTRASCHRFVPALAHIVLALTHIVVL